MNVALGTAPGARPAVDNVNEPLRENGQIEGGAVDLMPIGNIWWIPVLGRLSGWRAAGKPALMMVELDAAVRRHSRNRVGNLELAASMSGQRIGRRAVLSGRSQ